MDATETDVESPNPNAQTKKVMEMKPESFYLFSGYCFLYEMLCLFSAIYFWGRGKQLFWI
jgi:hypothetical protein